MSVFKQNPFLAGFGVVMVLGVGALGYLAYSASDENAKALSDYREKQSDLKTLQSGSIYPSDQHLKEVKARKQELQAKVDGLQRDLAETKIKREPILPAEFQNKLTAAVVSAGNRTTEAKVKFPGNEREKEAFYLGFDAYRSTPPKVEAAPGLYRQLKAIEAVVNLILEARNVEVLELTRSEIAEEKEVKPAPVDPRRRGGKPDEVAAKSVITRQPFTIRFVTSQENFKTILNGIVSLPQQLMVVRTVAVHNTAQEPPPKVAAVPAGVPAPVDPVTPPAPGAPVAPPAAAANPAGAPAAPDAAPAAPAEAKEVVFGKELIDVALQIDIVDVADLAAPEAKGAAKK